MSSTDDAGARYDSVEDLVRLKIHGINGSFVRRAVEKGHEDLTTEGLIRLRTGRGPV